MGLDGGGRRLAGGGGKLEKFPEELVTADEDPDLGGAQPEGIRDVLQGVSAGGVTFRVRDMGHEPPHVTSPGKFSTQGREADHREADKEEGVRGLVLSTAGDRYGGGGIRRDRGLHYKEAEHGRIIYCNTTDS